MPKLLHLLLFLSLSNLCFSQQKTDQNIWHLTVVDSNTTKGIDKATLSLNKKQFYISDNKGKISISKELIHKENNIIISCVGYRSVGITITNNEYPDTIRLSSSVISLKEVEISPSKSIEMTVKAGKKKNHNIHRLTSPDEACVQFIPNEKKIKGTITSVQYAVNDLLHGIEMPFRVRLFTKMKDSITLDKELTTDSIIIYNPQRKTLISVDVSKYNIQMPETGVLVVFETMPRSYYSKDSTLVLSNGQKMVKTPGIDMIMTKNYWGADYDKTNRETPYSMVGPSTDRWNWNGAYEQWYVYAEGNNFAISITISPQ